MCSTLWKVCYLYLLCKTLPRNIVELEWSDFSFDHYTKQFSFSYEKIASLGLLAIIRSTFKHDPFSFYFLTYY